MAKYFIVHEVEIDAVIDEIEDLTVEEIESAKEVGVFRAPSMFCHCAMGKRNSSFTRGQKHGWWIHTDCGKPTRLWGLSPGAVISAVDYHLKEKREREEALRAREIASQEPLESPESFVI